MITDKETELRDWMCERSPLSEFSQTIRAEAQAPSAPVTEGDDKPEETPDPFKGIDFDELPDDIRDTLQKAKDEFGKNQTEFKALSEKSTKLEHFGRQQQSRADQLDALARKHNLSPNGNQQQPSNEPESNPEYKDYVTHFRDSGLPEEQAKAMAKMWVGASSIQQKTLMSQFGQAINPLVATVGDMHADRMLQTEVSSDKSGILAQPEIQSSVRESLASVVKNGGTVTPELIGSLANMAYGAHLRGGGSPFDTNQNNMTPTIASPFGTSGGYQVPRNAGNSNGQSVASNPETQRAADSAKAAMLSLIGGGKKGGKK